MSSAVPRTREALRAQTHRPWAVAGDGDNRILNDLGGTVDVKAESTAKQSGSTTVTFGKPTAGPM